MKRSHHVMLRLTAAEHAALLAAVPPGEELAVFARKAALSAAIAPAPAELTRRAAAFVVAALSPEIAFDDALSLFDDHVTRREVAGGRSDQE